MADEKNGESTPESSEGKRSKFGFNVSFGRKPPIDDETYQRLLERATKDADSSADSTGSASEGRGFSLEFSDGRLRFGDSDPTLQREDRAPTPEEAREAEAWDRLAHIGTGAYPDTARLHRLLRRVVTVLALSVPVALCVLTIATGQSLETVVFATLFGLVVGFMFMASFPGMRN